MTDDLDAARALLPGVRLRPAATLSDGERSTVQRVEATRDDGAVRSLIVKRFHEPGEGWARECAALATMAGDPNVPELVAYADDPPVLVLADLGEGSSVADALLGEDPGPARLAVVRWAEALARLHVASRDARPGFSAALAARSGDRSIAESWIPIGLDDGVRVLDAACGSLGVAEPSGALDELRGLAQRLGGDGIAALTPADTCPDDNEWVGDRLVLTDFEGAQWRHVAWDVAYLRVPWPTCWCSWNLPDDVADEAVAAYRGIAGAAFPAVAEPAFERDVDAAVVGWSVMSTTWYLDLALDGDPPREKGPPTPSRRATILHRLDGAARSPELPALAELAGNLRAELHSRWGDVPLPLAPAFRAAAS